VNIHRTARDTLKCISHSPDSLPQSFELVVAILFGCSKMHFQKMLQSCVVCHIFHLTMEFSEPDVYSFPDEIVIDHRVDVSVSVSEETRSWLDQWGLKLACFFTGTMIAGGLLYLYVHYWFPIPPRPPQNGNRSQLEE
jgi:hypothetical protein